MSSSRLPHTFVATRVKQVFPDRSADGTYTNAGHARDFCCSAAEGDRPWSVPVAAACIAYVQQNAVPPMTVAGQRHGMASKDGVEGLCHRCCAHSETLGSGEPPSATGPRNGVVCHAAGVASAFRGRNARGASQSHAAFQDGGDSVLGCARVFPRDDIASSVCAARR